MELLARTTAMLVVLAMAGAAWAQSHVYRVRVDGLACPFCAYGIEKTLGRVDGVKGVDIDIDKGTVFVTMAQGATLDEATTRQAVSRAGFTMRGFEPPGVR